MMSENQLLALVMFERLFFFSLWFTILYHTETTWETTWSFIFTLLSMVGGVPFQIPIFVALGVILSPWYLLLAVVCGIVSISISRIVRLHDLARN